MRTWTGAVSLLATLGVTLAAPSAAAQSGVRDSLDGSSILVNKDVGEERWAISFHHASGTVTGNVFFPDGRDPAFVWCAPEGEPGSIEPAAPDLALACYGSDPCDGAPCAGPAWSFLANVTLPVSFFLVGDAPAPTASPTPAATPTPAPTSTPPRTTPSDGSVPASPDALFAFLQSRAYTTFAAESEVRPTSAPHMSLVRTFLNPTLEASLAAGAGSHPVGAAAVKELYDSRGELAGWAAMVKIADSDGSDGAAWYWYEVFSPTTGSPTIEGVGNTVCTGCHASGADFVRIPFPLP